MFDYPKWRAWLNVKSDELRTEDITVKFQSGPDDGPKPGMSLGLVGNCAMAVFENWITGETDYTIEKPPSPRAKMVAHKWGALVTDETFETTFNEFIAAFRQANSN
jgi:hypothetical protein